MNPAVDPPALALEAGVNVAADQPRARDQVRGAQRLFEIVEQLSGRPMTLTGVSKAADLPKSTALRFLRTLEESGWVSRDSAGVYSIGPVLAGIAAQYLAGNPLVAIATPHMKALHDRLDETISLSRRIGQTRVCVQEFPSTQNLRFVLGLGEQGPLHAGASGLLLYAYMPEPEREKLTEAGLTRYTTNTIVDREELEAEAARIRERGWAVTMGQKTEGAIAMAVPVIEPGTRSDVAALGVFGPQIRCSTTQAQEAWKHALLETAEAINESTRASGPRS